MKLLFDESPSPKLPQLLSDLARAGDRTILEQASAQDFILVSTDSDFEGLLKHALVARSSFCVPAIIQPMLRHKSFGAMRSVSLSCPVPKIT